MKKAELVRNIIIQVRSAEGTAKDARARAVLELGLSPAYARNCVAFNWERVTLPAAEPVQPAVEPVQPAAEKPARALSMSKDAIRKREARARAAAARAEAAVAAD